MADKVLITGGTGTLGKSLTKLLVDSNYNVCHLSRSPQTSLVETFYWDYKKSEIDSGAFTDLDYLVHLAGAPVVENKWTRQQKAEIKNSRVKSAELLFKNIKERDIKIKAFISASALGYYGYDSGGVVKKEDSRFGDDFLATVVKEWESAAIRFTELNIRNVSLRIGLILSKSGGVLHSIAKPIRIGLGAPIGSGDQYMSWIHVEDMAQIIKFAMENKELQGIYNSVAPMPVTNSEFTKSVAEVLKKPMFLPGVPGFFLKLILGERASMILGGTNASSEKIQSAGFNFKYKELKEALKDLL